MLLIYRKGKDGKMLKALNKDFKSFKENEIVEIKVIPKINDRFWKQKLRKIMANLFGSRVFYKNDRPSRRIKRTCSISSFNNSKKVICIFLDLGKRTSFTEISSCLEEIQNNLEKEGFSELKILCFYWNKGVKILSLNSLFQMKEKIELIYVKEFENHLDDFLLESKNIASKADLFITITNKNDSSDLINLPENILVYKKLKNKFVFCFITQGLEGKKLEIDQKIENNSIVVYK